MASTAKNNHVSGPRLAVAAPKTGSVDFNQGDILKVASNLVLAVAAVADVVHGIADDTNPVASLGDDLTRVAVLRPGVGVIVKLPLKSGDTVAYDDVVYISSNVASNPQEVSSSSANSAAKVGRCRELASVTAGASTQIIVEFLGADA